jgi:hypothetical protein
VKAGRLSRIKTSKEKQAGSNDHQEKNEEHHEHQEERQRQACQHPQGGGAMEFAESTNTGDETPGGSQEKPQEREHLKACQCPGDICQQSEGLLAGFS